MTAAAGPTPRQQELLGRWGYPYVMEEFRFHVTLTGRLAEPERASARAILTPLLRTVFMEPLRIHSLCLFEQPQPGGRFALVARHSLGG